MGELLYEQRMRLKYNLYACRTAYKRLENAIKENDNHEIYAAIGELLLWVMTTHEWYKKHGNPNYLQRLKEDSHGVFLFGLSHAYNSLKHNMKLFILHNKEDGFSFNNIDFNNFDFRPYKLFWVTSVNILDEGFENQRRNYEKYIEGKDVPDTFNSALIFLNQEAQSILFDKGR
ncbi:hypothetical protein CU633_17270 [Bacillus sp. V3-13]|uniref:hypothetical protein n=1 Tax=Bacillus sp. V3-13 TaxID=2053728 RepID=UPI000C760EB6|nr:hypothetical protein [Bacillus sp. V3-13]PLR76140.1 hypothetical protein CU633_17270 [Bacillus sp. V3-13]